MHCIVPTLYLHCTYTVPTLYLHCTLCHQATCLREVQAGINVERAEQVKASQGVATSDLSAVEAVLVRSLEADIAALRVSGVWHVACGVWRVVCGEWCVVSGEWRVVCGEW